MKKNLDIASLFLCVVCFLALATGSFIITMVNRISAMDHVSAWFALGRYTWIMVATLAAVTALAALKGSSEWKNFLTGLSASVFVGEVMFFTGLGARILMLDQDPTYRITWGVGSYLILACWYGIVIKCNERISAAWKRQVVTFSGIGIVVVLFATGWMDRMSIMTEYFARSEKFHEALWQHLGICVTVLGVSVVVGLPLGYLCYRNRAANSVLMGILNVVRSIPSIALIMVMVTPLSFLKEIPFFKALGVSSFGATPVFCALFLYALFQIVNSLSGALKTIDDSYIKTARAMGMTNAMVMWRVQIPLVLPVLISGFRVAIVSTFAAASLGTMVGYGGLGVFITMGSSSAVALDLILLGAVPIIIMIFVINFLFGLLGSWLERRLSGLRPEAISANN